MMFGPYNESDFPMKVIVQTGKIENDFINWNELYETTLEFKKYSDGPRITSDEIGVLSHYDPDYQCFLSQSGGVYGNGNDGEYVMRVVENTQDNIIFKERFDLIQREMVLLNKIMKK